MPKRKRNSNSEKTPATLGNLTKFVTELCIEEEYDDCEGRWTFRSGGDCCRCTDSAFKIVKRFGGRVVGFCSSDNPSAQINDIIGEGHDFALIQDRFIIDYWLFRVHGALKSPVLDLRRRADAELAGRLFGNRDAWEEVLPTL
jgi:hypothetical protein